MDFQEQLLQLEPSEFEDLIHDLLEAEGFQVIFHSGKGTDRGRDLEAIRVIDNSLEILRKKYIVQCKRWKINVSEKDIPNIYDKIKQFNADGYLLAVVKGVTTGLAEVIFGINIDNREFCGVWNARDITNKMFKYPHIMEKYFPEIYKDIFPEDYIINNKELINLFMKKFQKQPQIEEMEAYILFIVANRIREIKIIESILFDEEIIHTISNLYIKLLKRDYDPVGLLEHGYYYKNLDLPREKKIQLLEIRIRQSSEFKAIARYIYNVEFMNLPFAEIRFNQIHQHFYNWKTYHSDVKDGTLTVKKYNDFCEPPLNMKYFEIESPSLDKEFRLVFENLNLVNKKSIVIDLAYYNYFQIFLLVTGDDNKHYFIQYINESGEDQIKLNDLDGYEYLQFFNISLYSNGPLNRFDRDFNKDFRSKKGINVRNIINLYLGVKGKIQLYNILFA